MKKKYDEIQKKKYDEIQMQGQMFYDEMLSALLNAAKKLRSAHMHSVISALANIQAFVLSKVDNDEKRKLLKEEMDKNRDEVIEVLMNQKSRMELH